MYKTKIRNILMAALILLCFLVCGILYSNTGGQCCLRNAVK